MPCFAAPAEDCVGRAEPCDGAQELALGFGLGAERPSTQKDNRTRRAPNLFCRLSVEVFLVSLRVSAGIVDDAVPMVGWRI